MNIYWFIAFIAYSAGMFAGGVKYEFYKSGEADARHDIAQAAVTITAQKNVIDTIGKQQAITQGVDNAYENQINFIDAMYPVAINGMQSTPASASASMPAIAKAAGRPDATTCQRSRTRAFKLTPQQCDKEAQKLVSLQQWIVNQEKISP